MTATRRRITGLIGTAIGLVGLVFVIIRLAQDWDAVTNALTSPQWPLVLFAIVVGITGMTTIGLNCTRRSRLRERPGIDPGGMNPSAI